MNCRYNLPRTNSGSRQTQRTDIQIGHAIARNHTVKKNIVNVLMQVCHVQRHVTAQTVVMQLLVDSINLEGIMRMLNNRTFLITSCRLINDV